MMLQKGTVRGGTSTSITILRLFSSKKKILSKYICYENPKKQEYSDKMSRAFPYETVYKVTSDNFILIARLRQNANFSSLVCSSVLFCLFHVGEKITYYVPAD